MFKKALCTAAVGFAAIAASPASADPWYFYDGYYPAVPSPVYAVPYGYPPAVIYSETTVAVPVITYVPMQVLIYAVPQVPPYYNVPPYAVYTPY